MDTIKSYRKRIFDSLKRIEENRDNPNFFELSPILGMHDNGKSMYECELANIKFFKSQIKKIKERG